MNAMRPDFTTAEQSLLAAAAQLGFRFGGAVRRFRGFTLVFHSGSVGDITLHRIARREMPRWIAKQFKPRKTTTQ